MSKLEAIEPQMYQGTTAADVIARDGTEGYPRFGIGPKRLQQFTTLEEIVTSNDSRGLLPVLAERIKAGGSLRSVSESLPLKVDSKLLGQFLQLAGIPYLSRKEAISLMWQDEDFRRRNAEGQRNRPNMWDDPEYRTKMTKINGDNLRRQWQDPEYRERRVEEARGQMVELWQDPSYREKTLAGMEAAHRNPETSKKRSERMKKRWQDPEFRARQTDFSKRHFERLREDPTFQQRITATLKRRMEDPEEKQKTVTRLIEGRRAKLQQDPEFKRQLSERSRATMLALWEDPDFQQKVAKARPGILRKLWEDPDFRELQAALNRQRWEEPAFREKMQAANQKMWQDPEYREKMIATSAQARQERWKTDPEFAERMRQVLLDARLDPANRERMVLPTLFGFRSDINFFAQSMWEANIARVLMLLGRDFVVGEQLQLQVPEHYRDVIPDAETTMIADFTTANGRGDIVIYEIMAHPFKDPEGWAKFLIAKDQFPEFTFRPITRDDYKQLQGRFEAKVNADARFHGWETYKDNLRTNPTKYS